VVLSRTQPALVPVVLRINEKCGGIRFLLVKSLLSLILLLSIFWSFFLFDILGDHVGVTRATWMFSVMAAIPGSVMLVNYVLEWIDPSFAPKIEDWDREMNVESTVTDPVAVEMATWKPSSSGGEVLNVLHE
jgi:hypothetical protein